MIFITGYHCAGKTETARILSSWGFHTLDLGPALREYHRGLGIDMPFREWYSAGERQDEHFTDDILVAQINGSFHYAEYNGIKDVALVGSRSLKGITFLREHVTFHPPFTDKAPIVYLRAPLDTLFARYRSRPGRADCPREEFMHLLEEDTSLGLETIIGKQNFIIDNDGSLDTLKRSLVHILRSCGYVVE